MAALHQRLLVARLLAPGPDPPDPPAGDERSDAVGLEKKMSILKSKANKVK
jgi:hypothetical protein